MVGVVRASKAKWRHTAEVWGMYVTSRARSTGMCRALLQAAIAYARRWPGLDQVQLSVSDTALEARGLYEAAGFRAWGREPRALHWQGRFVDLHHLAVELHLLADARPRPDSRRA